MDLDPFDTREYWRTRLQGDDIAAVGRTGLSRSLNQTLYSVIATNVRRMVGNHQILPIAKALDVGAGWGFWVDYWHSAGISQVDAVDFADQSIATIAARWPAGGHYWVADLADVRGWDPVAQYQLVSCMNVLLHIVDDEAFKSALTTLARVVAPGGYLLLAEPAVVREAVRSRRSDGSSRSRPIAAYTVPGLSLVDIQPAVALAGDPVDAPWAGAMLVHRALWRSVVAADRFLPPLRPLISAGVRYGDEVARRMGRAQTSKLLLFRRASP